MNRPLTALGRRWGLRGRDAGRCEQLAAELRLPLAIVSILYQRGVTGSRAINDFLHPSLKQLPDPDRMQGMAAGVSILAEAVDRQRPITIYGDYDADGVTATALLLIFLRELGAEPAWHIPNRLTEGYGLNRQAIQDLGRRQIDRYGEAGVLVTVDNGIAAVDEIRFATELGFTVVITDHHRPSGNPPPAHAVINPRQAGCPFPDKNLAGVGVAFYLLMGLRRKLEEAGVWKSTERPNLKAYLDLVAVGTVADQVPLTGINRILVKGGEDILRTAPRPGLAALLDQSGIEGGRLTAEDIAFRLAPRLNAAGRLAEADTSLALLMAEKGPEAAELAKILEDANKERKQLEGELTGRIEEQIDTGLAAERKTLVLHGDDWHPGIIGIVAARLTERYCRPAILLTASNADETEIKGSGRSIPGLNLHQALIDCKELLNRFGGHAGAAGLALEKAKLPLFREKFEQVVADRLTPDHFIPALSVDWEGEIKEICDRRFLEYYARLAPFGQGNPEPVFICRGARLHNMRVVGDKHLRFVLRDRNGYRLPGIGFGFARMTSGLDPDTIITAVKLRINEYRGRKNWELNLVDIL